MSGGSIRQNRMNFWTKKWHGQGSRTIVCFQLLGAIGLDDICLLERAEMFEHEN